MWTRIIVQVFQQGQICNSLWEKNNFTILQKINNQNKNFLAIFSFSFLLGGGGGGGGEREKAVFKKTIIKTSAKR
jgi:hypothetical protein